MNKHRGFTLIEMAIVLLIIGILLGTVLMRSGAVIGNAKTTDTLALVKDLSSAINDFKTRYHYLPGDMPKAGDEITGISSACNIATSVTAIGNGQVDTDAERNCVAEDLVKAGFIKGSSSGIFSKNNASVTPDVLLTARRTSGAMPPDFFASNEIQLSNQPCETATGIEAKLDDGNFSTGNIRASVASCNPSNNEVVPFVDIAL